MRGEYIDFISVYCDSWCERCPFTHRCSAYAVQMATGMCGGDFEAGLELAIGPPPPETEAERTQREEFFGSLANAEPTPQEIAAFEREREQCEERIEETPTSTASSRFTLLAHRWLKDRRETVARTADAALADALEVAAWDRFLIHVKLHRALTGRDEAQRGEGFDDHPIQNDWNGSAKVALISIDRSLTAWNAIADATGDPDARHVVEELEGLRTEAEHAFPNARKFRRPGFDA
jgi:hypothetical protein